MERLVPVFIADRFPAADACGRIAAVAVQGQRDLQECVAAYRDLFPAGPFDPALCGAIALANAVCAPWLTAGDLRATNRTALWTFALDHLVDVVARTDAQVDGIVRRCGAVAEGGAPAADDPLTAMLGAIRDEFVTGAPDVLLPVWRDELRRTLDSMARESRWVREGVLPTVDEYLSNAANLGFSFVFASHWLATTPTADVGQLGELTAAGHAVQAVIRLVNDLATVDRDVATGDLNVLLLGPSPAEVRRWLGEFGTRARELVAVVQSAHPRLAGYLWRQVEFNSGFHPLTDYWDVAGP
jgi:hypothetical protein